MVEAIANGVEDKLIDGLSFKMTPGASYVVDRRSVTYHPQGSNIYMPGQGTKLIRILLTGDNWMDPSTFRVMFTLNNLDTGTKRLRPLGGPWSFFRRMRILAAGQLVEDVMEYNRIHEMFHMMIAKESRENDAAEAFGVHWDSHAWENGLNVSLNTTNYRGIAAQEGMTVLFKPLSGILNQNKLLPLRYAPITIELELVDSGTDPIISNFSGNATNAFKADNTSTNWSINNVQVKCDVCTLDNALDNSYAQHLLSGKSLPITYNTFISQIQTIAGQDNPLVTVSRAITRLKSVFVTLSKEYSGGRSGLIGRKFWNDFFSPMSSYNYDGVFTHEPDAEFEFQLQIGSKLFPEYPIRSHSEAYYQLKKTLGVQASAVHNFDVSAVEYRDHKFVVGTDCEKVLDAGFTGINTRAGDLLSIKFKYNSAGSSNLHLADRMHIILHSDQIMEIRDTGVAVYD